MGKNLIWPLYSAINPTKVRAFYTLFRKICFCYENISMRKWTNLIWVSLYNNHVPHSHRVLLIRYCNLPENRSNFRWLYLYWFLNVLTFSFESGNCILRIRDICVTILIWCVLFTMTIVLSCYCCASIARVTEHHISNLGNMLLLVALNMIFDCNTGSIC